jgi:hypothetical protein
MQLIQQGIIECMNECLNEIKRCNIGIEIAEVKITDSFFGILKLT